MNSSESGGVSLAQAFGIVRGDVVSFVGGGGKTTSMFRLARELSAQGMRVVTTTTTRIAEEQVRLSPAHVHPDAMASLGRHLDRYGQCLVVGRPDGSGSVFNIPPEIIIGLKQRPDIDCILVEADGSKSRPFKAPAPHEPVVPAITTVLSPVAGMDCMGRPLDERCVHRPEIVASLTGCGLGSPITPAMIARILAHTGGGAKNLPFGARLVPLLNKADGCDIQRARETARKLLGSATVDSVVIGSTDRDPPVRETWVPTAAIIQTCGENTRPSVRAARAAADAGLDPVLVIGPEAVEVSEALTGLPVSAIRGSDCAAGSDSFVRAGIEALPARTRAALFVQTASPIADAAALESVLQARRKTLAPLCVFELKDNRGRSALVDRTLFAALKDLATLEGIDAFLEKHRDRAVNVYVD
jgi:molybdenum cofactor cytidylyltransferase